ncbi:hypothetical protein [[Eubacterium] cellulosolvens]
MDTSLKISAVAGLIGGIISGIVFSIFAKIALYIGFWEPYVRLIYPYSMQVNVLLGAVWGVILGTIYSKAYSVIPSEGIQKGVYFGLIIYVVHTVHIEIIMMAYGYFLDVAAKLFSFFFMWLTCGLILGILYEYLYVRRHPEAKESKIKTYNIKSGIIPGAIAGIIGGIAISIMEILGPVLGIMPAPAGPMTFTISFWLSQAGAHIFVKMLISIVFGALFARFYNLIPGKGVMKGFMFGLTLFLIASLQYSVWFGSMAAFHSAYELAAGILVTGIFVGLFGASIFGLALGLFYRKPSD